MRYTVLFLLLSTTLSAQGIAEKATDTTIRPVLTGAQAGVPAARGAFVFAPPYDTQGYRLTLPSDCPASRPDCVQPVGYSYWPQISNSADSHFVYAVVTLRNGGGPTLFALDKRTDVVTKIGPLFSSTDSRRLQSGEGWYFSFNRPTVLYVTPTSTARGLQRVDVVTRQTQTVFDVTSYFGAGHYIWQAQTSNDDRVHSFTLKRLSGYATLGCGVYFEQTRRYQFYPSTDLNECHVDKSGRWLVMKEQVDDSAGEDNRFIHLETGAETLLIDQDGAGGHSDMGIGAYLARDNWAPWPAIRLWKLWDVLVPGPVVYRDPSWAGSSVNHISWTHATHLPISSQYACGSGATRVNAPRTNEIVCFRLDGSLNVLTVAPVMTRFDTGSAGNDPYKVLPKGHLDATGEYFLWSTNLGTSRTDVVMVRVPWAAQ
jgi:hypothetical protein